MGFSEINAKIQYAKDPNLQERFGSLENYMAFCKLQLKSQSAWTFGKNFSNMATDPLKDWVTGKEKSKVNSYYARMEYDQNPKLQERFGSFEKYYEFTKSHSRYMALLEASKNLSDNIKKGVSEWVGEKEQDKINAEKRYEAAMRASQAMEENYENALKELETKYMTYGDDTSKYSEELNTYTNLQSSKFDADLEVEIARDHLNSANSFYGRISYMG